MSSKFALRYNTDPEFRERHQEYMAQSTTCECGCTCKRYNMSRHRKTKKHQRLMQEQSAAMFQ